MDERERFQELWIVYKETGDESKLREAFNILDIDHDERITREEIIAVARKCGESESEMKRQAEHFMKGVDTNRDELITYEEFKGYFDRMG